MLPFSYHSVSLCHGGIVLKTSTLSVMQSKCSTFRISSLHRLRGRVRVGVCICLLHFRRITPLQPLQRHNNCTAADYSLTSAALAPIQRHRPNQPPHQNVNSAASPLLPASHFSGSYAIYAMNRIGISPLCHEMERGWGEDCYRRRSRSANNASSGAVYAPIGSLGR